MLGTEVNVQPNPFTLETLVTAAELDALKPLQPSAEARHDGSVFEVSFPDAHRLMTARTLVAQRRSPLIQAAP